MRDRQSELERDGLFFIVGVLVGLLLGLARCDARDLGQWSEETPQLREWYKGLMQPDNPSVSCCGEADAYFCDDFRYENGKVLCTISDERDDVPRKRAHIEVGTIIEIPEHKLKWDRGNPTGHGVVFLSRSLYVFCYVQPGGV